MCEADSTLFVEMTNRYTEQNLPWDVELPPPEVLEVVDLLSPGRALDLGCGFGRTCRYLAKHGWQCDGVDFVEQAIVTARQRTQAWPTTLPFTSPRWRNSIFWSRPMI